MKCNSGMRNELYQRRSPHGERGLKLFATPQVIAALSRSPHGERGLKFDTIMERNEKALQSLSSWRAWIEISMRYRSVAYYPVALLMESVD